MMLRIPNVLTLISQPSRMSAVTRIGQPIAAARLAILFRMARLYGVAEMANQAVERLIFGHCNGPRPGKVDRELVDDGRWPSRHDQHAVREECGFANAVGDENHRLAIGLPNALQLDRHFVARD